VWRLHPGQGRPNWQATTHPHSGTSRHSLSVPREAVKVHQLLSRGNWVFKYSRSVPAYVAIPSPECDIKSCAQSVSGDANGSSLCISIPALPFYVVIARVPQHKLAFHGCTQLTYT